DPERRFDMVERPAELTAPRRDVSEEDSRPGIDGAIAALAGQGDRRARVVLRVLRAPADEVRLSSHEPYASADGGAHALALDGYRMAHANPAVPRLTPQEDGVEDEDRAGRELRVAVAESTLHFGDVGFLERELVSRSSRVFAIDPQRASLATTNVVLGVPALDV